MFGELTLQHKGHYIKISVRSMFLLLDSKSSEYCARGDWNRQFDFFKAFICIHIYHMITNKKSTQNTVHCKRKKQSRLFDRFKAFVCIESSHESIFFRKYLFSVICATCSELRSYIKYHEFYSHICIYEFWMHFPLNISKILMYKDIWVQGLWIRIQYSEKIQKNTEPDPTKSKL